jgi:hypothetical protein
MAWLLPVPVVLGAMAAFLVRRMNLKAQTMKPFWLAFVAMALTLPLAALLSSSVIPRQLSVENLPLSRLAYNALQIVVGAGVQVAILGGVTLKDRLLPDLR